MELIKRVFALFGVFMFVSVLLACTQGSCKIALNDKVLYERVEPAHPSK